MSTKTDELMRLANNYAAEFALDRQDVLNDSHGAREVLRSAIHEALSGAAKRADQLLVGDLLEHKRNGVQFVCRSVTISEGAGGRLKLSATIEVVGQ